ncbi:acetyl-CoA carboxylase, biotin carboxyl carrier protein [Salipaludibacillus keqinensis]|uniref:Biotin carboxyl carrier protein of acetyl-CoA carboxylase n=1 Tax=Salipaludibacillus keqinensis TaxID=2045207 RepID=A0A323TGV6_9BACI|nr:acetyl-CoA carboxylase biotin carboxyl carrier protein [Salipaludibacillus keqinensis]PYZ94352.1 acetyl-CoA carboxylase, biotin carboxyl carrier protein [Salipaludibacillus keqinensis]
MLKIQEIRELIKLIDESSIDEFKFEQNGSKVTMKKQSDQSTTKVDTAEKTTHSVQGTSEPAFSQPAEEKNETEQVKNVSNLEQKIDKRDEDLHTITSPMVGTYYESPSPDSPPYVKKGDEVKQDSVVCIVEAMKLMNEIEAEIKGEVVEVLVENGQLVEYGQELFLVKPE